MNMLTSYARLTGNTTRLQDYYSRSRVDETQLQIKCQSARRWSAREAPTTNRGPINFDISSSSTTLPMIFDVSDAVSCILDASCCAQGSSSL